MKKGAIFEFEDRTFRFDCYSSDNVIAVCLTPKEEDGGRVWWCIAPDLHDQIKGPFTVH
jgi:hypothetical protein